MTRCLLIFLLSGCAGSSVPSKIISPGQAAGETVEWVSANKANRRFVVSPDVKTWTLSERINGLWVVRRTLAVDPSLTAPYVPIPRG